jgi:hypothetical protein
MWNSLIDSDPSAQILTAWIAKDELRKLLTLARTDTSRDQIASRLHVFYDWCASAEIDELTTCGFRNAANGHHRIPAPLHPEPPGSHSNIKIVACSTLKSHLG